MHLQESGEMYLETILILSKKSNFVRAIDVGEHMGYSKPSVSRAVGLLKAGGYIQVDENGAITLLPPGQEVAERIYERHRVLTDFFTRIGVDPDVAEADACRIEHVISEQTFNAWRAHEEAQG